jgi:hypothetical protein
MRRLAFYDLRDWWLADERIAQLLRTDRGFSPFYPAADQPESSLPYIRYDVDRRIDTNTWWIYNEGILLDIFTESIDDSNEIMNRILDYSVQGDESARELERWIIQENRPKDFEFHSIEYLEGGNINPPDEQGGSVYRSLMLLIRYSPLEGRLIAP